jgi:hypothetical protein
MISVAVLATLLGVCGWHFRWRGAVALLFVTIAAGVTATWIAARDAETAGLHFGFTVSSVLTGLFAQIGLSLAFYAVGVIIAWLARRMRAIKGEFV